MASTGLHRMARRPRFRRKHALALVVNVGLTCLLVVVLAPCLLILLTALKSTTQVVANPLSFPSPLHWQWSNFKTAWVQGGFGHYFLNSVIVSAATVTGDVVLSLLAAYAFALSRFRGKKALFVIFLVGLTVPLDILIIPLFYNMLSLGLLDSLWALILPQIAIGLPFGILLLRSFIESLPQEVIDAGRLDGASRLRILLDIVVPLARPGIISLIVFKFMFSWNQFLLPTVLIQSDSNRTLPVGLNYFQGRYVEDIPLLMAGAAISALPIILIYAVFQRQFIKGIMAGALK